MPKLRIHWAGGVKYDGKWMLPGWPCCCYGTRAARAKIFGNQTCERNMVTCLRCLTILARADLAQEEDNDEK